MKHPAALLLAAALALPVAATAVAGELMVHTVTAHVGLGQKLRTFTPGLAYTTNGKRVGVLSNSYGKPSLYAAAIIPISQRTRIGVGAISGYKYSNMTIDDDSTSVIPLVAAEVDVTDSVTLIWFMQAINISIKF